MLLAIAILAVAWFFNAGKILRMYFMSDKELVSVRDRVAAWVNAEIFSREDRRLATAIIAVESSGNPGARSGSGSVGLMQVTAPALADYNAARGTQIALNDTVANPALSVRVGFWYLRSLELNHGLTIFDALRAYNAGIGNVRRDPAGEVGSTYAAKVLAYSQRLGVIG